MCVTTSFVSHFVIKSSIKRNYVKKATKAFKIVRIADNITMDDITAWERIYNYLSVHLKWRLDAATKWMHCRSTNSLLLYEGVRTMQQINRKQLLQIFHKEYLAAIRPAIGMHIISRSEVASLSVERGPWMYRFQSVWHHSSEIISVFHFRAFSTRSKQTAIEAFSLHFNEFKI